MNKTRIQDGYSVLEALAAIALIAAAFIPLLNLQGQLTRTVIAMERAELATSNINSALAFLRSINPTMKPQGEEQMGAARLVWQATPLTEERPALDQGGAPGRFVMQLYDIEATLSYEDGRQSTFTVRAVGWRPLRPAQESNL